jgi:hypothetical protein
MFEAQVYTYVDTFYTYIDTFNMLVESCVISIATGAQQSRISVFMITTYSENLAQCQVFSLLYLQNLGPILGVKDF